MLQYQEQQSVFLINKQCQTAEELQVTIPQSHVQGYYMVTA